MRAQATEVPFSSPGIKATMRVRYARKLQIDSGSGTRNIQTWIIKLYYTLR